MEAKVALIARSKNKTSSSENIYDDGHLRVEHDEFFASCDGQSLKLARSEFLMLSSLVQSIARAVPPEELWRNAWGDAKPLNSDSLSVHMYRLRRKLAPYDLRIETMVFVGYRLIPRGGN